MLDWPKPKIGPGLIQGEVIYLDHFGNAITNIGNDLLPEAGEVRIFVRTKFRVPLKPFYQAVPPGHAVALPGSSGFQEVAVNGGNAAVKLGIKVGSAVAVNSSSPSRGKRGAAIRFSRTPKRLDIERCRPGLLSNRSGLLSSAELT